MKKRQLPPKSTPPFTAGEFAKLLAENQSYRRRVNLLELSKLQQTDQINFLWLESRQHRIAWEKACLQNKSLSRELHETRIVSYKQAKLLEERECQVADLTEKLRIAKLAKNSSNSSRPPSTDLYKPPRKTNTSLRQKSDRKTGGQHGHTGSTLLFNPAPPDVVVPHSAAYCEACGSDLSLVEAEPHQIRQIIDIPPPCFVRTNHVTCRKVCACGHCNTGSFPQNVSSYVSYGPELEAMVVNLHARQYLPYDRTAALMEDLYGLSISEGTIANILKRATQKAAPVYGYIQRQIFTSGVVGADETSAKVNGDTHWLHTYQTPALTFIGYHPSRGTEAREAFFPIGLPNATLVTDCLAMQLSTPARSHQVCLSAHIMRELKAIQEEHPGERWPLQLKKLFADALELKKKEYTLGDVQGIERSFAQLLQIDQSNAPGKIAPLWRRLIKHSDKIFTFLYYQDVPSDNNASERAIRNVKVKQKVSGQFKSAKGAQQYAILRSIIDTAGKQHKNVHDVLVLIANLVPG